MLEFVEGSSGHGIVKATAGSGKTSTLVQVARQLVPSLTAAGREACFLAFNRATAAELRARLPDGVEATTLHALGRRMLIAEYPQSAAKPPEPDKYRRIAARLLDERHLPARPELAAYLARLASFARLELTDPTSAAAVTRVAERYRLAPPLTGADQAELERCLPELLEAGARALAEGRLDFTDMAYLPVRLSLSAPGFGFVCVDEAQDLSALALALVMKLVDRGARALFVGDPRQAIYAFAGADARGLQRIRERTMAAELPLSVSYRCPLRHVALARRFAPEMEARPRAPTGRVRVCSEPRLLDLIEPGDLVIARTNQDLVSWALRIAARGLATRVLGSDLSPQAAALAEELFGSRHDSSYDDAPRRIELNAAATTARLERELITDLKLPSALQRSADAHQALALAVEHTARWRATVNHQAVLANLTALFGGEAGNGASPVVLSTIHRAKGREADRVFLLAADLLAAAPAASPEEDESEANVLFVALTRAKRELVLVESRPRAIAQRLATPTVHGADLPRHWNDVLRLASRMHKASRDGKLAGAERIIRAWQRTLSTRRRAASSSS